MNGEILRGDVYWVSVDDSIGSEIRTGRTAVVVSGDKRNEKSQKVIVVYTTSSDWSESDPLRVKVNICGKPNRVVCDEIRTVDKQRLTRYVATLTNEEMARVTGALANAQCIPILHKTVAVAVEERPADSEEVLSLRVELETMRRMYEKVLEKLVDIRVDRDLAKSEVAESTEVVEPAEPVEPAEEKDAEPEYDLESKLVEINTCSLGELRAVGCPQQIAEQIIYKRPHRSVEDLKKIPQLTRMAYGILSNKVCCVPVEKKPPVVVKVESVEDVVKVDINAVSRKEMMEALGCSSAYAGYIVTHRNKHGKFNSLEELLEVQYLTKVFLERYRDRLTVSTCEQVEPAEDEKSEKEVSRLDINTASTRDFMAVGFGKRVAALIVNERKRFGNYRSVDDLSEIDGVTGKILRKLKDVLYVGDRDARLEV